MSAELTKQLLDALLGLIAVLITGFLIPYLKQKYSLDKRTQAYQIVKIAVQSTEQLALALGWSGQQKKEQVLKTLSEYNIRLTDSELDTMIESAVLELTKLEKQFIEP